MLLLAATLYAQTTPPACDLKEAIRMHQSGDYPGALRGYQACVAANPGRAETRSNLGAVLAHLGRFQEAIEQYKVALEAAPAAIAPGLRFNLALAYYKSFQIAEAAVELEALHREQPADMNIALLLADCRLRTAEWKSAIDLLLPLEPSHPENAALDYVLGMAMIRDGRIPEGQLRVDRILGRGESAEGHFMLGAARFSAGNFPAAAKEFERAQTLNSNLPSLHSYYGQALLFSGDADGAAAAFRKELAANPNDYDANYQLASILSHRGKPEEARPLLERAVQVRPGSEEARAALAHGFGPEPAVQPDPGVAAGSPAPRIAGLDLSHLAKPVVLVFGSYTCPKLRFSAAGLKRLAEEYRGKVDFRLVYIREAHTAAEQETHWQSTINEREGISLAPARDITEKNQHAEICVRKLNLPWPVTVDGMGGEAETAYQAWPSRVYVVDRGGRVAFQSRLGELDFRPADLESALRLVLGGRVSDARPR